ncbi:hypothetical protein ACQPXM_22280 [Kribbella sp. CA-253562]|uniref:hypothetical protein n=1 Tax=Kribbella sp. CA-253562 TaxID=3239942 RepID=UPI003D8DF498
MSHRYTHRRALPVSPTRHSLRRPGTPYSQPVPGTTYLPHGVAIACASGDAPRPGVDYVDLAVVELDAATAYLDELTGTGLLALPPGTNSPGPATLDELDRLGWLLLDGDHGSAAVAGRTTEGSVVLCLYADFAVTPDPDPATLHNTLTALHFAAGLLKNP